MAGREIQIPGPPTCQHHAGDSINPTLRLRPNLVHVACGFAGGRAHTGWRGCSQSFLLLFGRGRFRLETRPGGQQLR